MVVVPMRRHRHSVPIMLVVPVHVNAIGLVRIFSSAIHKPNNVSASLAWVDFDAIDASLVTGDCTRLAMATLAAFVSSHTS